MAYAQLTQPLHRHTRHPTPDAQATAAEEHAHESKRAPNLRAPLCVGLAALLVACGGQTPTDAPSPTEQASPSDSANETPTSAATVEPTAEPTAEPTGTATAQATPIPTAAPGTPAATPAATPAPTPDATPIIPSPYIYEQEPAPEPQLNASELGVLLTEAMNTVFNMPTGPLWATYEDLVRDADPNGCPILLDYPSASIHERFWVGECTAQSGTDFSGEAYTLEYDTYVDPSGAVTDGWYMGLSGGMEDRDGRFVEGAGEAADLIVYGPGYRYYLKIMNGLFLAGDSGGYTEGLEGDSLPALTATAVYSPPFKGHLVALEGGMGGMRGQINTLALSGVTLGDANIGFVCPIEPTGMVSLRDESGNWYDVLFDTPEGEDQSYDPSMCDGCGDTWYRGAYIGEVCGDFSALLAWETAPW